MGETLELGARSRENKMCYSLKHGFPERPKKMVRSQEIMDFPQDGPAQA